MEIGLLNAKGRSALISNSLCNLCVLCVSVVSGDLRKVHYRDTENTEVAQKKPNLMEA